MRVFIPPYHDSSNKSTASSEDSIASATTLVEFDQINSKLSKTENRDHEEVRHIEIQYAKLHCESVKLTKEWTQLLHVRNHAIKIARVQMSDTIFANQILRDYAINIDNILTLRAERRPFPSMINYSMVSNELEKITISSNQLLQLDIELRDRARNYILEGFELNLPPVEAKIDTLEGLKERIHRCLLNLRNSKSIVSFLKHDIEEWHNIKMRTKEMEMHYLNQIDLFRTIMNAKSCKIFELEEPNSSCNRELQGLYSLQSSNVKLYQLNDSLLTVKFIISLLILSDYLMQLLSK